MKVLYLLLTSLPAFVAAYGLYTYMRSPFEGETRQTLRFLAAAVLLYFICVTLTLTPGVPSDWLVFAQVANGFLAPLIQDTIISFFYLRFHEVSQLPGSMYLWFALPVALFAGSLMLCYIAGYHNVADFRYLVDARREVPDQYAADRVYVTLNEMSQTQDRIVLFLYMICTIVYGVWILLHTGYSLRRFHDFCFRGGRMSTLHITVACTFQMLLFVMLGLSFGRYFLSDHPWVACLINVPLAYTVLVFSQANKFGPVSTLTIRQLFELDPVSEASLITDQESQPSGDADAEEVEDLELTEGSPLEDPELRHRLRDALIVALDQKKLFLQPGLKVGDLAHYMGTNRFYLSRYINEIHDMNFNEFIACYRIEYAKQYMKNNHFESIERIAVASGFRNVQSFSRKFKEQEGVTPSEWFTNIKNQ